MTAMASEEGYSLGFPEKDTFQEQDGDTQVLMGHMPNLFVTGSGFKPEDARANNYGDWNVEILMAMGAKNISMNIAHGSPFAYFLFNGTDPQINFQDKAKFWSGNENSAVLGVTIAGNHFGIFAPAGTKWTGIGKHHRVHDSRRHCGPRPRSSKWLVSNQSSKRLERLASAAIRPDTIVH